MKSLHGCLCIHNPWLTDYIMYHFSLHAGFLSTESARPWCCTQDSAAHLSGNHATLWGCAALHRLVEYGYSAHNPYGLQVHLMEGHDLWHSSHRVGQKEFPITNSLFSPYPSISLLIFFPLCTHIVSGDCRWAVLLGVVVAVGTLHNCNL